MGLTIQPEKALEKINSFIAETDKLLQKNYSEGKEEYYGLDVRIRTFVNAAFSDSKQKISSYSGFFIAAVGHEPTHVEKQKDYLDDLKRTRRHLVAWKEEVELNFEVSSDSSKLNKIKSQINETGLEVARRQKVAEEKFYGAVIELLDFQRNLIKEKEQTTKSIIEIKKDITDIKEMISRLLKNEKEKLV